MALPGITGERPCLGWTIARERPRRTPSSGAAGLRRNARLGSVGIRNYSPRQVDRGIKTLLKGRA
jgi:hypothetical protein